MTDKVLMPSAPPAELSSGFIAELFELCRDDDYAAIYVFFVKHYGVPPQ